MAKRVTEDDIKLINEAYLACGTYTGAAAATGWSASTIKKYVNPEYKPSANVPIESKEIIIPSIDEAMDYLINNSNLLNLTDIERNDLKNIWKGMIV